jgi:hypothetical protein
MDVGARCAYQRLTEALNKARRARVVAMDAIRDDGFTSEQPLFYASAEHCLADRGLLRKAARIPLRSDTQMPPTPTHVGRTPACTGAGHWHIGSWQGQQQDGDRSIHVASR